MSLEFIVWSALRFIGSLLILRFPLFGILISAYLDSQDWHFLNLKTDFDYEVYRIWDKIFDTFYLSLALFVSFSWKDKIARLVALVFFIFRTLGILLFIYFNNSLFLFIFPNIFENFFIFYFLYKMLSGKGQLFKTVKIGLIIIASILLPKFFLEYLFHVVNISPFDLVNLGELLGTKGIMDKYLSQFIFILIYLSFPVVVLYWVVKKNKAK